MKRFFFTCFIALLAFSAQAQIVITEIMFNPPEVGTDSLEYIELYNNSSATVDLNGYSFSQGVTHTFTSSIPVAPGAYVVIAVDSQVIVNNYGINPIAQWTSGGLSNGGEDIAIQNAMGVTVDSVDYDDAWGGGTPDGSGPSLVRCDPNANGNSASNWQASASTTGITIDGNALLGSPGTQDAVCALPVVPEFSFVLSSASVQEDAGMVSVDVGVANPDPNNSMTVDVVFDAANSTADASDHNFSSTTLTFAAGATANQSVSVTITDDMMQEMDEDAVLKLRNPSSNASLGIDSVFTLTIEDNDAVPNPVSGLVITEIMYNLPGPDDAEYIEFFNNTTAPIDLMGAEFTEGVTHEFMQSTIVEPGEYFVITSDTIAFATIFNATADAQWTSGATGNSGEDIVLVDNTGSVIDSVDYDDGGAWPAAADGDGPSLVLCDPSADNADPTNWGISASTTFLAVGTDTLFVSPGLQDAACQTIPTVGFASATSDIGENMDSIVVSVSLSNPINSTSYVSVDLASTGSAVAGTDFNFTPVQLIFPAGSTAAQTATVFILDDSAPMGDVTVDLELSNGFSGLQPMTLGTSTVSITIIDDETLSLNETGQQALTRLFPNPAKQQLTVEMQQGVERLQITNMFGQVVRNIEQPNSDRLQLNVADLAPGRYQVTVQTTTGVETQSFIKQ